VLELKTFSLNPARSMARKSVEYGKFLPRKVGHLEGNLAIWREIYA